MRIESNQHHQNILPIKTLLQQENGNVGINADVPPSGSILLLSKNGTNSFMTKQKSPPRKSLVTKRLRWLPHRIPAIRCSLWQQILESG